MIFDLFTTTNISLFERKLTDPLPYFFSAPPFTIFCKITADGGETALRDHQLHGDGR